MRGYKVALFLSASCFGGISASAQTLSQVETKGSSPVVESEVIVVTAQRRAQRLQDVPNICDRYKR